MRLAVATAIALSLTLGPSCCAQNVPVQTAKSKLQSAVDATTFDAAGTHAWHWTIAASIYNADGKNAQRGTIEAWFADGNMRTMMTLEADQMTTFRLRDKLLRSATADVAKFIPLEMAFAQALRPIPDGLAKAAIGLKLVPQSPGAIKLDCIQPWFPTGDVLPFGAQPLYCFQKDSDKFVAAYQAGITCVARTKLGTFLGKQVPIALVISSHGKTRVELTTTALATFSPAPDEMLAPDSFTRVQELVEVPQADLVLGLKLVAGDPIYPSSAKQSHTQGSLKFDVIIGVDGRVKSSRLLNDAPKDLVDATTKAIEGGIYRPYLINGRPVEVHSTVTTNFSMAPSIFILPTSTMSPEPSENRRSRL